MRKTGQIRLLGVCLFGASTLLSQNVQQAPDSLVINELKPVTVAAYRVLTTDLETPFSMSRVTERSLQGGTQKLALDEALNTIPGVFAQNSTNFAQDLRLSVRGYGSRSAFGIRGIKVLLDGFPESTADGTAQVDAVDPAALTSLSLVRTSTGGLYGNASGGYLDLRTLKYSAEEWREVETILGSFGYLKTQFRLGGGVANKFMYAFNTSYSQIKGYREHSAAQTYLVNGGVLIPFDSLTTIRLVASYVISPLAEDPGGITGDEDRDERKRANPQNVQYNIGEQLWQARFGVSMNRKVGRNQALTASFYQQGRSFENNLVSSSVDLERLFTGGNFSYDLSFRKNWFKWDMKMGADLEQQTDDRKITETFEDGSAGGVLSTRKEQFKTIGLFVVNRVEMGKRLSFLPSIRYDHNFISVDFDKASTSTDYQVEYQSWNPSLGFSFLTMPNVYLFGNLARNFETPTLLELSRSNDLDLKPQRSETIEFGYKALLANGKWRIEQTVFRIRLWDEIVISDQLLGNPFYSNASKSNRRGMELAVTGQVHQHLILRASYTLSNFEYTDYGSFTGKKTPGIPKNLLGLSLDYWRDNGFHAVLSNRFVDELYVNNGNGIKAEPYWLVNLSLGKSWAIKKIKLDLSLGINNVFDKLYYANIRINSLDFYEPAPTRNFFGSLKVSF